MCMCVYICMHVYIFIYAYIYTHTRVYIRIHIYMYTHAQTHTHTHVYSYVLSGGLHSRRLGTKRPDDRSSQGSGRHDARIPRGGPCISVRVACLCHIFLLLLLLLLILLLLTERVCVSQCTRTRHSEKPMPSSYRKVTIESIFEEEDTCQVI